MSSLEKFIFQSETLSEGFASWIILQCPYEVDLSSNNYILMKDVDDLVEGKWSSYYDSSRCVKTAYFELESDAMAFKLTFL